MIHRLFRPALIKRFVSSVYQDGMVQALHKTRGYCGRAMRGMGHSALTPFDAQVGTDHLYLQKLWQHLAAKQAFHIGAPPAFSRKTRKIAIIADLNLPQCRKYRVEQIAVFWRSRGVEVSYAHCGDVPRAVKILQDATHLMLYRLQASPQVSMYMYEARRLRLPILYDLDDPLFSVSAYETYQNMAALTPEHKRRFLTDAPKYLDVMNGADAISVSTPGMAEHTRQLTPRPVWVRRNFADGETLGTGARIVQAQDDNRSGEKTLFRVAFASGSWGHEIDFALIEPQIVAFLQADPSRRLMVLGRFAKDRLPPALQARIETHKFAGYNRYLELLSQADCAVMPLRDDLFNQCKSAVRVLDAAAVGVPSLVSAVGDQAYLVHNGVTGFVIKDPEGWGHKLEQMACSPDKARQLGRAARNDVETRWAASDLPHIIDPALLDWVQG